MEQKEKKTMLILACACALMLILLGVFLGPGMIRYTAYKKLISNPRASTVLSIIPQTIDIPQVETESVLSLGYVEISIYPNDVNEIKIFDGCIVIDCNIIGFGFLQPVNMNYQDVNHSAPSNLSSHESEFIEDFYAFAVKSANIQPKSWLDIVTMTSEQFAEYFPLVWYKVSRYNSQNGILIFDTPETKGLIYLGEYSKPGRIEVEVHSKRSKLSQTIIVKSDSPQKSKDALLSLLASYKLLITEELEMEDLQEMMLQGLANHKDIKIVID